MARTRRWTAPWPIERDLPGALALDLGVPLGTLRLAGADLRQHVASGTHDVPLPLGGSEGAQPPASPCRGPAKRGPKG